MTPIGKIKSSPKGGITMAKYRVTMMEKIFYEVCVEADNEDEAEDKAIEAFDNGDVDVADQYVDSVDVEEEEE